MVRSPRFDVALSFCLPPVNFCSDVSRYGMIRSWILLSSLLIAFVLLMELINLGVPGLGLRQKSFLCRCRTRKPGIYPAEWGVQQITGHPEEIGCIGRADRDGG
jgi:hypothetical protein